MSLQNRYTDAYLVARAVNGTGQTVKFVGYVVAALLTLIGFVAANQFGAVGVFAGLLLGGLTALPFYALGVLVSAQGQILMANLDTAVNSSPLLSQDEIRNILTGSPLPLLVSSERASEQALIRTKDSDAAQAVAEKNCPHCGGALEADVSRCRWCMKRV
ncbi:MAG TPA: hypothetical protein VN851_01910 [Thermoanaerobaculia bacterium]|nr:hypothetical protein [Thermoanaerobaculia bacterium]